MSRRRADVAWSIALLFGLVVYQQLNALTVFANFDTWLNAHTLFPHYPDPISYLGIIVAVALVMAGFAWVFKQSFARADYTPAVSGRTFVDRTSTFRSYFLPLMYGIIPVVGADYFARQLPKFFQHLPRVPVAIGHLFGFGSTQSSLYNASLISSNAGIIAVQVGVMAAGTLAAMWTSWRIAGRDLAPVGGNKRVVQISAASFALALGVVTAVLYILMNAAD